MRVEADEELYGRRDGPPERIGFDGKPGLGFVQERLVSETLEALVDGAGEEVYADAVDRAVDGVLEGAVSAEYARKMRYGTEYLLRGDFYGEGATDEIGAVRENYEWLGEDHTMPPPTAYLPDDEYEKAIANYQVAETQFDHAAHLSRHMDAEMWADAEDRLKRARVSLKPTAVMGLELDAGDVTEEQELFSLLAKTWLFTRRSVDWLRGDGSYGAAVPVSDPERYRDEAREKREAIEAQLDGF